MSFLSKIRMNLGRKTVQKKIHKLINLLKDSGYEFVTFSELLNIKLNNIGKDNEKSCFNR
jgi:hypothetical protein